MVDHARLAGEWEVEQQSAITGDPSARANVKARLSLVACKGAFLDSQAADQFGVGAPSGAAGHANLSFGEFRECLARLACAKYASIPQMDLGGMSRRPGGRNTP